MTPRPIKLLITLTSFSWGIMINAYAQSSEGHIQTQPWGYEYGEQNGHYEAASRGQSGNRLIVNGRVVDLGDSGSPSTHQSSVFNSATSSGLPMNVTLGHGTTLNSVAIGNSIDLRGISNSTLILNQYNFGTQSAGQPGAYSGK